MTRKSMPAAIYAGAVITIDISSLFAISYRQDMTRRQGEIPTQNPFDTGEQFMDGFLHNDEAFPGPAFA